MFDAKNLLEAIMRGAAPSGQQQAGASASAAPGGLGDLLGQIMGGGGKPGAQGDGGMGGLGDILGKLGGGASGGQSGGGLDEMLRKMMPGGGAGSPGAAQGGGGGLGDILGKLGGGQAGQGGGLADILGQILGQASSGVKEAGQQVEQHTGIGGRAREAVTQATGQSPDDLLAKLKDLIAQHQLGAAATAGGLGAVVLGSKTGRSAAMGAAKLGALALIGGLAYKAYQNYSQGKPLINTASGLTEAPGGSGFEPQAVTNDTAILYIRAMIAAAASDGNIDAAEQTKIMGALKQAGGADQAARDFLMEEINKPATADQLAAACQTQEQAIQVFTAARLAVDLDSQEENDFLVDLAGKLGLDEKLVQHIDAAAGAQSV